MWKDITYVMHNSGNSLTDIWAMSLRDFRLTVAGIAYWRYMQAPQMG